MALGVSKIYVMIKNKSCFLLRCSEDLHVTIHTMFCFLQLRDLVCEEVQSIAKNKGKKALSMIGFESQLLISSNSKPPPPSLNH